MKPLFALLLPFEDARVVLTIKLFTNEPFGEIKETLGGFITVKAESVEEAVNLQRAAPFYSVKAIQLKCEK